MDEMQTAGFRCLDFKATTKGSVSFIQVSANGNAKAPFQSFESGIPANIRGVMYDYPGNRLLNRGARRRAGHS